jgi:hypothetical protein
MFQFMQRFGRDSQTRWRGTEPVTRVRRRDLRLNCEALDSRQLLSAYYIVNEASGKVLGDPGPSTLIQDMGSGSVTQEWRLVRYQQ